MTTIPPQNPGVPENNDQGATKTPGTRTTSASLGVSQKVGDATRATLDQDKSFPGTRDIIAELETEYLDEFKKYIQDDEHAIADAMRTVANRMGTEKVSIDEIQNINIKEYVVVAVIENMFRQAVIKREINQTDDSEHKILQLIKKKSQHIIKKGVVTRRDFELGLHAFFKSSKSGLIGKIGSYIEKTVSSAFSMNETDTYSESIGENPHIDDALQELFVTEEKMRGEIWLHTVFETCDPMASYEECITEIIHEWVRHIALTSEELPQTIANFSPSSFENFKKIPNRARQLEIFKKMMSYFSTHRDEFAEIREEQKKPKTIAPVFVFEENTTESGHENALSAVPTVDTSAAETATETPPATTAEGEDEDDMPPNGELDSFFNVPLKDLLTTHTGAPKPATQNRASDEPAKRAPVPEATPVPNPAVKLPEIKHTPHHDDPFADAPLSDGGLADELDEDVWPSFPEEVSRLESLHTDQWEQQLGGEPTAVDAPIAATPNTPIPPAVPSLPASPSALIESAPVAVTAKQVPAATPVQKPIIEAAEATEPGTETRKVLREVFGITSLDDLYYKPKEQPEWVRFAFNKLLTTDFKDRKSTEKFVLNALYIMGAKTAPTYAAKIQDDDDKIEEAFMERVQRMYREIKSSVEDSIEAHIEQLREVFTNEQTAKNAYLFFRNKFLVGLFSGTETHEWNTEKGEVLDVGDDYQITNYATSILPNGSFLIEKEGGVIEVRGREELTRALNANNREDFENALHELFAAMHNNVRSADFISNEEHSFTVGRVLENGTLLVGSLGGKMDIELLTNDGETEDRTEIGTNGGYEFSTKHGPCNHNRKLQTKHQFIAEGDSIEIRNPEGELVLYIRRKEKPIPPQSTLDANDMTPVADGDDEPPAPAAPTTHLEPQSTELEVVEDVVDDNVVSGETDATASPADSAETLRDDKIVKIDDRTYSLVKPGTIEIPLPTGKPVKIRLRAKTAAEISRENFDSSVPLAATDYSHLSEPQTAHINDTRVTEANLNELESVDEANPWATPIIEGQPTEAEEIDDLAPEDLEELNSPAPAEPPVNSTHEVEVDLDDEDKNELSRDINMNAQNYRELASLRADDIEAADTHTEYHVGPEGKEIGPHYVWAQNEDSIIALSNNNICIEVISEDGARLNIDLTKELSKWNYTDIHDERGVIIGNKYQKYITLLNSMGIQKPFLYGGNNIFEIPKPGDYIVVMIEGDQWYLSDAIKIFAPRFLQKIRVKKKTMSARIGEFLKKVGNITGSENCFVIRVGDTATSEGTNKTPDEEDPISEDPTEAAFFSTNDDDIARIAEATGFHDEI